MAKKRAQGKGKLMPNSEARKPNTEAADSRQYGKRTIFDLAIDLGFGLWILIFAWFPKFRLK
jgi:hypothetical protein